jgi:hypothetical protein
MAIVDACAVFQFQKGAFSFPLAGFVLGRALFAF